MCTQKHEYSQSAQVIMVPALMYSNSATHLHTHTVTLRMSISVLLVYACMVWKGTLLFIYQCCQFLRLYNLVMNK